MLADTWYLALLLTSGQLPVGLHLMGNHWHEHDLLCLGDALDDALESARVSPSEFFADDILSPQAKPDTVWATNNAGLVACTHMGDGLC